MWLYSKKYQTMLIPDSSLPFSPSGVASCYLNSLYFLQWWPLILVCPITSVQKLNSFSPVLEMNARNYGQATDQKKARQSLYKG